MDAEGRKQMSADLKAVGFSDVTMLTKPCEPSEEIAGDTRVVAA
jgi:hypothetical protein